MAKPAASSEPPSSEVEPITAATLARPVPAIVRDDMTVDELAIFLLDHRLSSVAVANAAGKVVGFASMTDLVREHVLGGDTHDALSAGRRRTRVGFHEEPRHTCVRDIMMPFVLTLQDRSSIPQTAAVMAARGVHRLLLVSEEGEATGLIYALDVLRWFSRRSGVYVPDDPEQSWRRACESAR